MVALTASTLDISISDALETTGAICFEQSAELVEDSVLWLGDEPLRFWYPKTYTFEVEPDDNNIVYLQSKTNEDTAILNFDEDLEVYSGENQTDAYLQQEDAQVDISFSQYLLSEAEIYDNIMARKISARKAEAAYWRSIDDED